MKTHTKHGSNKLGTITILAVSLLLGACSSLAVNEDPLVLIPGDDELQGPGIFSGADGGFDLLKRGKQAVAAVSAPTTTTAGAAVPTTPTVAGAAPATSSVRNLNLNDTSKVLDEKIKQLERNQIELELLKREVDRKIKAQ